MPKIARALLSVYDKTGIVAFARGLQSQGVELLSSGGTSALLKKEGVSTKEVSSYTGSPEILGGRVKTLHPMIHGGILAKRDKPDHQQDMAKVGISPIDLVVVNLYPFQATISKPSFTHEEALENIDIGGPTLIRAAAKNYKDVIVVVDPTDYPMILDAISKGEISEQTRLTLARKAFHHTADYDRVISSYLDCRGGDEKPEETFPAVLTINYQKVKTLRYGENPHQKAAFYKEAETPGDGSVGGGWGDAKILWGKEMSYNNFLDTDSALSLASEFKEPVAVIVKHNNPCGVATGKSLLESYQKAKATDPASAFGGVAAFNQPITEELAAEIITTFMEVVAAPGVSPEALTLLQKKKDLRVLTIEHFTKGGLDFRKIAGGLLVQEANLLTDAANPNARKVVTRRVPTPEENEAMAFAWKVCKHIKSNAIVLAHPGQIVGIGAGQMSRIDSVQIALMKAKTPVAGTVMASDAFFPFRDGIDAAGKAGISAIIQPGGSIRDPEVIQAADEHNMAMVFTGIRHFRH